MLKTHYFYSVLFSFSLVLHTFFFVTLIIVYQIICGSIEENRKKENIRIMIMMKMKMKMVMLISFVYMQSFKCKMLKLLYKIYLSFTRYINQNKLIIKCKTMFNNKKKERKEKQREIIYCVYLPSVCTVQTIISFLSKHIFLSENLNELMIVKSSVKVNAE